MHSSLCPEIGRCLCGARVFADSFRDRESYLEFHRTARGLCQACQDSIFLGENPDEPAAPFPIVDGALAAVRTSRAGAAEACLLPFRLVAAPQALIAWEARFIVRAGPALEPLDPWRELEPMRELLDDHHVRVSSHRSLDAPGLEARLANLRLLVGLDRPSLDAVHALCTLPPGIPRASLADEVPWRDAFARSLLPLGTWCAEEPEPASALLACALMGLILVEHGRGGRRPLDHLLASRPALFSPPRD